MRRILTAVLLVMLLVSCSESEPAVPAEITPLELFTADFTAYLKQAYIGDSVALESADGSSGILSDTAYEALSGIQILHANGAVPAVYISLIRTASPENNSYSKTLQMYRVLKETSPGVFAEENCGVILEVMPDSVYVSSISFERVY